MSGRKKDKIISGTVQGAKKTVETNRKKHGIDFYKRIGSIGGKLSRNGGFAADKTRAKEAGSLGGSRSRKGYKFIKEKNGFYYYESKVSGKVVKFQV